MLTFTNAFTCAIYHHYQWCSCLRCCFHFNVQCQCYQMLLDNLTSCVCKRNIGILQALCWCYCWPSVTNATERSRVEKAKPSLHYIVKICKLLHALDWLPVSANNNPSVLANLIAVVLLLISCKRDVLLVSEFQTWVAIRNICIWVAKHYHSYLNVHCCCWSNVIRRSWSLKWYMRVADV